MLLPKRKRTLSVDPMAVVSRFVDAANRHDAEGVEACLHPDFESIQPTHPARNFKGARQVRRNWQAIFQAEPGFRLTVLRSSVTDDTAWVELHGAGESAEVSGVLVFGVEGGRLRWSRIYSEMVERAVVPTDGSGEPPPPVAHTVPTPESARPVFEVIQGEGGTGGGEEVAAADAVPGEEANAGSPDAVATDDSSGDAAVAASAAAGDASAAAGDGGDTSGASTETLVGSEWAAPIESPEAPTADPSEGGDPTEPKPENVVAAESPVSEAGSATEGEADAEAAPAAKPASRRRKPRSGAATGESKPRRTRKKPAAE